MKTKKEEPTIVVTEKTGSYIFHSLYEALVFAGVRIPEGVKIDLPNTESPWQMYKVGYKEGYCDAVCKACEWLERYMESLGYIDEWCRNGEGGFRKAMEEGL